MWNKYKTNTNMNMKQILITLTMLFVLGMTTEVVAQKHRHTPQPQQAELVDSTSKNGVDAFSDTTSIDTGTVTKHRSTVTVTTQTSPWSSKTTTYEVDDDDVSGAMDQVFRKFDKGLAGMFFVLMVLLIIFVISPVLIIVALFYFINRNRKEKMRLAQMAMQQGQPIPEQLLNEQPGNVDEEYKKGMRQCFVGVGLMIFLGFAAGTVGFGVGALVFCIGLGKVFVSKTTNYKNHVDDKNDITKL